MTRATPEQAPLSEFLHHSNERETRQTQHALVPPHRWASTSTKDQTRDMPIFHTGLNIPFGYKKENATPCNCD
ncbi:hypothetical protein TNCV_4056671 [Trichonephila clavipes]|nr:hypothetical protein TNCV_4056671 [Trichonephila clavipes]